MLSIKVSINSFVLTSSINIANISAPTRPIISVGHNFLKIEAISCKSESPNKWPNDSLSFLKLSISASIKA